MIYIYSIQYNVPEFIKLQKDSFDKFIGENKYIYTAIDNSVDNFISTQISKTCEDLGINVIKTFNHTAGLSGHSHLVGLRSFLEILKGHTSEDIVILLDHDIFLISDLEKIKDDIDNTSILTIAQSRSYVYYLWPGLCIFNLKRCPNIEELSLEGTKHINGAQIGIGPDNIITDTGGESYYYLEKYKDIVNYKDLYPMLLNNTSFDESCFSSNPNLLFFHFHDGSNWSGYSRDFWNLKLESIRNFLSN